MNPCGGLYFGAMPSAGGGAEVDVLLVLWAFIFSEVREIIDKAVEKIGEHLLWGGCG